jgi:predicted DNA-binding transcriptional regulator AlpA
MLERKFYYIEDMAKLLGKSVMSIHGHLGRKQYDAVPPPMHLGRRLVWLTEAVDEWIDIKVDLARAELREQMKEIQGVPRRRGRPSKTETIRKKQEHIKLEILKTLETKNEKQE